MYIRPNNVRALSERNLFPNCSQTENSNRGIDYHCCNCSRCLDSIKRKNKSILPTEANKKTSCIDRRYIKIYFTVGNCAIRILVKNSPKVLGNLFKNRVDFKKRKTCKNCFTNNRLTKICIADIR